MALIRIITLWILLAGMPVAGFCAQQLPEQPATKEAKATIEGKAAKGEEHGISQKASEVGRIGTRFGPFIITNSMVVTWVVAICSIAFAQLATHNMKEVPDGAQNFWEWIVESLQNFLEGIIGRHLVQRTFWFFATIFIFILAANWFGLIPGVGTIGWGRQTASGFKVDDPLLRGANADLNMTLAMALTFFGCWIIWALQEVG